MASQAIHAQAFDIMLTVHKKGLAVVGVYSYEIAETKVALVMDCGSAVEDKCYTAT